MSAASRDLGICQCGCGQATSIAKVNDKSKGWLKGQPLKFVKGHSIGKASISKTEQSIGNKHLSTHGYVVVTLGHGERQYEHHLIAERVLGRPLKNIGVGHPGNEVVHHINGVKDDNRPENLLICTNQYHIELHARLEKSPNWPEFQQRVNHPNGQRRVGSSGFKGVALARNGKWQSIILVDGRYRKLGRYLTPQDAARAYDAAAVKLFGDTWSTNASMGLL